MNEGKQEMARVYIDILGSSELKWTGMGEFNSDVHFIYIYIYIYTYIYTHTQIYIYVYIPPLLYPFI